MTGRYTRFILVLAVAWMVASRPEWCAPAATASGSVVGNLYVTVAVFGSGSAVVRFELPADGPPIQRELVETLGSGNDGEGPEPLVYGPVSHLLFAVNNTSDDVSAIEVNEDGSLVSPPVSRSAVGDGPIAMVRHPRLPILYLSTFRDSRLRAFDIGANGALTKRQEIPGLQPREIGIDPTGSFLYLADLVKGVRGYKISESGDLVEIEQSPFLYPSDRTYGIRVPADARHAFALDLDNGVATFDAAGVLENLAGSPVATGGLAQNFVLAQKDTLLYVGKSFPNAIGSYVVGADGLVSRAGPDIPTGTGSANTPLLIVPPGTSKLFALRRTSRDVLEFAIGSDGTLSSVGSPIPILDSRARRPLGVIFVPSPSRGSPPVAAAGASQVLECEASRHATATLDGSGSSDVDSTPGTNDDIVSFLWTEGPQTVYYGASSSIELPLGTHDIELTVTDHLGFSAQDRTHADVVDSRAPVGTISAPTEGACFGPAALPVTVADNFTDACDPDISRTYVPGPGPSYQDHGDHHVVLSVADTSSNVGTAAVSFVIDTVPPVVTLLPTGGLSSGPIVQFTASDDDGASGGVVFETVQLDGCTIFDGRTYGNGDGLLTDETLALTSDELCRIATTCGFSSLDQPTLRVEATDCGGNVGSASETLAGSIALRPGICGGAAKRPTFAPSPTRRRS